MGEYQKVEVVTEETEPFSEGDKTSLEQEAETQEHAEQVTQERPEWLPEKFNSPEDMVQAYDELQSAYTKKNQNESTGEAENPEATETPIQFEDNTFDKFTQEFNDTGDVSVESREAIEKMGLPREMIDAYIEGQKSLLQNTFNSVYETVGGEDRYKEMLEWATENISESEQDAFNESVLNGTEAQMMFAIKSLSSMWRGSGDTKAPLIQGNTGTRGASGGFRSLAELTSAMKDPRYDKDPAYRKDVETRLANSNVL